MLSHVLTGYKTDLGEHNPFDSKVQIYFQIFAHTMMQLNRNISGMIHYGIWHIWELYGLAREVASTNAKEDFSMHENLKEDEEWRD